MLFISHCHADRAIADVVGKFVVNRSNGEVMVYQSSSSDAQGPRIGENINRELTKALWRSDVLVLIYTGKQRDWEYCMWECGVATHPESAETRVIVLQCGREPPRVFADQLAVEVRDPEKMLRFVNEFLTDPDFFPSRSKPVTRFQRNDDNVKRAAREFSEDLSSVIPQDEDAGVEEWPAVPLVQLEIDAMSLAQITDEQDDEEAQRIACRLLLESQIIAADREAAGLFDKPTLPPSATFGSILPRAVREGPPADWLLSLAVQVARAAQWNFPPVRWGLMRSVRENDQTWYGPVLTHVRRMPNRAMQFDIHFQRFACRVGSDAITLALPSNAVAASANGAPSTTSPAP
ncbi:MAG: toll/interleukin-1 receptor domain-containing protein [Solirubrobacteraceae bacterium]